MQNLNENVRAHYHRTDLFEEILKRLVEQGVNPDEVSRNHIAGVDEFHVRGAAVSKELASSVEIKNCHILDVGCGIGGPCRMLADEFNCRVTGIDLNEEYIRTAQKLTELTGLHNQIDFIQGNATELPFEENIFDVVWTQHVQMNIPDKSEFYSEINRVLKNDGYFLYYDIFKKDNGDIKYPVPWAETSEMSFLFTSDDVHEILKQQNLKKISTANQTQAGIDFFEKMISKIKSSGPPTIGLNLLMGTSTLLKISNLLDGLKTGKLELQSGVYHKV